MARIDRGLDWPELERRVGMARICWVWGWLELFGVWDG